MNYSEFISQILMVIALLVVLVNIITEVVKNIFNFKSAQALNVFVMYLSIALTVAVFFAYWQIKAMEITWYILVAFIIIGYMVAYAAMFGFDKLLKYFEQVK